MPRYGNVCPTYGTLKCQYKAWKEQKPTLPEGDVSATWDEMNRSLQEEKLNHAQ